MSFMSHVFDAEKHKVYKPKFLSKYTGKDFPICRSEWERSFMKWVDNNPNVIKWNSEGLEIPYIDPVTKKWKRYYPDFTMVVKNNDGHEIYYVVEIKPYREVYPPKPSPNKALKSVMYESQMYARNTAKWHAANDFCRKRGLIFKIITEKELF